MSENLNPAAGHTEQALSPTVDALLLWSDGAGNATDSTGAATTNQPVPSENEKKKALDALSQEVKAETDQLFERVVAATQAAVKTSKFSDRLESLISARSKAISLSSKLTHEERMASLGNTLKETQTLAAELETAVAERKRLAEEARAAAEARANLSKLVDAALKQMHEAQLEAISAGLNTDEPSRQLSALRAAAASANNMSTAMAQHDRMTALENTRKLAEEATAGLSRMAAAAKPATDAIAELASLIETFDAQYPGAETAGLTTSQSDLTVRQQALHARSLPAADVIAELEQIAKQAGETLAAAQAALAKAPAAAELRARVDAPLNAVRTELAVLRSVRSVDIAEIEGLVEDAEDDLADAAKLTDPDEAIAAAEEILAKVAEAQKALDAKKSDAAVADALQRETKLALGDIEDIAKDLEAVKKLGLDGSAMTDVADDLAIELEKASRLEDPKARADALIPIKKAADEALERADTLLKVAEQASEEAAGSKSDIYKKALEQLYGLKIEVPDGFTNTHFEKVFEMFGMVPKEFVAHARLKTLEYDPAEKNAGAYAKLHAAITMNDYPDSERNKRFTLNGKPIDLNAFNATTLHEIGHSVDALHGIMAAAIGGNGNGGWKTHAVDELVPLFVEELKRETAQLKQHPEDSVLTLAVAAALKSGKLDQPAEVDDADWKPLQEFLDDRCVILRADKKPWFDEAEYLKLGDRVYQESYANKWVSYDAGARASTEVSSYQWRSPTEWFSELFAVTWLTKKKPPSGVGAAVAKYLWPPSGTG